MITIRTVETEEEALLFTDLPYRLYRGNEQWVPPLRKAERRLFDPAYNPALEFCDVNRWIALREDGTCCGRVAAIVNHRWNKKTGDKIGRISRFECENDVEVAHELFKVAEKWLHTQGMDAAAGPLGFSNLDQQGVTIKGYDRTAALGSSLTMPYYVNLFEGEGYEPMQDWYEYRLTVPWTVPPKVKLIAAAARERFGLKLRTFSSSDELKKAAPELMNLFDRSFEPLFGTYPFTDAMKKYYMDQYLDVLDHRLVMAVVDARDNDRPVGFMIAMPSIVKSMRSAWGDIGLIDAAKVWLSMRHASEVEILLAAIVPEARRRGAFSLISEALMERFAERGIRYIETTAILSNNDRASTIVKEFVHERHKQKRCYLKNL